jgi:hydroxymethylglutaryl-CoA lyase
VARARIIEVGPRDGLQNEAAIIPTEVKIAFVDALSASGVDEVEVSAFVSHPKIPQLADAEEVFAAIGRTPGVLYSALVPNERGLERALAAGATKASVFTAASETFNRANINASIEESYDRFVPVVARARRAGIRTRGYVSTAFWCPYEGRVVPARAVEVTVRLLELGVEEVSIGDTIGKASPDEVRELLELLLAVVPADRLALHFHDTYGKAADNVVAGWSMGIHAFDASTGGIGGCPYAPGAAGNLATETLVRTLLDLGAEVAVDLEAIGRARRTVAGHLGQRRSAPGPDPHRT